MAEIKVQEGESIENALRRFKRKVQQEDIIKDIKKHSFYLKPGDKRRAKQALARKRNRKKIRRESEQSGPRGGGRGQGTGGMVAPRTNEPGAPADGGLGGARSAPQLRRGRQGGR